MLKQANFDLAKHQFNTVASAGMKMLNALEAAQKSKSDAALKQAVVREGLSLLLRLLSPMTPHITHQLWRDLGYGDDTAIWFAQIIGKEVRLIDYYETRGVGFRRKTSTPQRNAAPSRTASAQYVGPRSATGARTRLDVTNATV